MACTAISVQGGEKFLSNEDRSRRLAQRRFAIALGVSTVLHAALLGWPAGVGTRSGASEFQTGKVSGGRFEARLVSPAQTALLPREPQEVVDAAQVSSDVPIPTIREGTGKSMGAADGSLLSAPTEPNPVRPGFPDVRYFTKKELSKNPRLVSAVSLVAPRGVSLPAGAKISLQLWISENGRVDRLVVVQTNVPVIMTESAVAAFKAAQFQPGEIDGETVKSQLAIEVSYELDAPPTTLRLTEPTGL